MQNTIEHTQEEIQEIERHKYFLSEKAGYDVGWEYAVEDWNSTHADRFRRRNAGIHEPRASGRGP